MREHSLNDMNDKPFRGTKPATLLLMSKLFGFLLSEEWDPQSGTLKGLTAAALQRWYLCCLDFCEDVGGAHS